MLYTCSRIRGAHVLWMVRATSLDNQNYPSTVWLDATPHPLSANIARVIDDWLVCRQSIFFLFCFFFFLSSNKKLQIGLLCF